MKRGFTLIELAIVIVIAGILAAVAVPIFQSLTEDAKWTEGKAAASTVVSALRVYATKNTGFPNAAGGGFDSVTNAVFSPAPTAWGGRIGLTNNDFANMTNFSASDIFLTATTPQTGTNVSYIVRVRGTGVSGRPTGVYAINEQGRNVLVKGTTVLTDATP